MSDSDLRREAVFLDKLLVLGARFQQHQLPRPGWSDEHGGS